MEMGKLYVFDVSMFRPVWLLPSYPTIETLSKEEKAKAKSGVKDSTALITKRQKKVMEKVKDIRKIFSKAAVSGSWSGSKKFVYEFYVQLITPWFFSSSTEPLSYGVEGDNFWEDVEVHRSHDPEDDSYSLGPSPGSSEVGFRDEGKKNYHVAPGKKRKAHCIPKLIANNKKAMKGNVM